MSSEYFKIMRYVNDRETTDKETTDKAYYEIDRLLFILHLLDNMWC